MCLIGNIVSLTALSHQGLHWLPIAKLRAAPNLYRLDEAYQDLWFLQVSLC